MPPQFLSSIFRSTFALLCLSSLPGRRRRRPCTYCCKGGGGGSRSCRLGRWLHGRGRSSLHPLRLRRCPTWPCRSSYRRAQALPVGPPTPRLTGVVVGGARHDVGAVEAAQHGHVVLELLPGRTRCDGTAKLKCKIKRNCHHLNISVALT